MAINSPIKSDIKLAKTNLLFNANNILSAFLFKMNIRKMNRKCENENEMEFIAPESPIMAAYKDFAGAECQREFNDTK